MGIINRLKQAGHLDDAAFAAIWAASAADEGSGDAHLDACPACRARYAAFVAWADGIRDGAIAEADEAFPPDKLAAQHAHVFRRLEAMERPARVITFPKFARPVATQHQGARRWIAAAAAAGLVLGLVGGQMIDLRRKTGTEASYATTTTARTSTSAQPGSASYRRVSLTNDEAVLMDIDADLESTSSRHMPEPLRALDELTPHARDYDTSR